MKLSKNKISLRKELIILCILSFIISFVFYKITSVVTEKIISDYYNTNIHIEKMENKYIGELQKYINEEGISKSQIDMIDKWVFSQENVYLKLFYKGSLLYDTLYGVVDYSQTPYEDENSYSKFPVYTLKLKDCKVSALIICYDFQIENYTKTILIIISSILFLTILLLGVKNKIKYLEKIAKDLEMSTNNLDYPILVKGNDEITLVAESINTLRRTVIEKLKNEKDAYDTNINLITALSHELKTPLTSVISYIELALTEENIKTNGYVVKCLNIALEKALHLKKMTNNLFEHFLLHCNKYEVLFETVQGNEFIAQMLEENLYDLEEKGISIKREVSVTTSNLLINISLIHSLFENVFSNIRKYADLSKGLYVQYYLENNYLVVSLENYKKEEKDTKILSAQIGLHNCTAIMEKHGGRFEVRNSVDTFKVKIYFLIQ